MKIFHGDVHQTHLNKTKYFNQHVHYNILPDNYSQIQDDELPKSHPIYTILHPPHCILFIRPIDTFLVAPLSCVSAPMSICDFKLPVNQSNQISRKTGYLTQRRFMCAQSFLRGPVLKLSNVASLNNCLIRNNCLITSINIF